MYAGVAVSLVLACQYLTVSGLRIPATPSLSSYFKMNVMYKPWFDEGLSSCTVAYSSESHAPGNHLYVSCRLHGVNTTKHYDFGRDVLHVSQGGTAQPRVTRGIPEAEKDDPYFPVTFRTASGRKVFDQPDSLIRFTGDNKRLTQRTGNEEEWETDVIVVANGETYQCTNSITWSRNSAVSPYCDDQPASRGPCPLVPLVGLVSCGEEKIIRYSVIDYVEEYDPAIFEYGQPDNTQNATGGVSASTLFLGL
ncbi:uncharacterized protein LOC144108831 isoform X1 [Amblyomma americanum]